MSLLSLATLKITLKWYSNINSHSHSHSHLLPGGCAQVREGLRWVAPKAKVWSNMLCTLTWTSTNHLDKLIRISIDKTTFVSVPDIWI